MQVDRMFVDGMSTVRTTLYTAETIVRFYFYLAAYVAFAAYLSQQFNIKFVYADVLASIDQKSSLLKKIVEGLFHPIKHLFETFYKGWT